MSNEKVEYNLSEFHGRLKKSLQNDKGKIPLRKWAKILDVHPTTISQAWLQRGAIPGVDKIIKILETKPDISPSWLLLDRSRDGSSQGCDPECPLANGTDELKEHCKKVKAIIDSKTTYSGALKENIIAFHEAVEEKHARQAEIDALKDEMSKARTKHENEIKAINKRLNDLQSHQGHFSEESVAPPTGTDEGGGTER